MTARASYIDVNKCTGKKRHFFITHKFVVLEFYNCGMQRFIQTVLQPEIESRSMQDKCITFWWRRRHRKSFG